YDRNQCHRPDPTVHDKSNGRIYRIVYNDAKPVKENLQRKSNAELVELLKHENQWYSRHARRVLQERAAAKSLTAVELSRAVDPWFQPAKSVPTEHRLRALWAAHSAFGLNDFFRATFEAEKQEAGRLEIFLNTVSKLVVGETMRDP